MPVADPSLAAFGAGAIRTLGEYRLAFWIAGGLCLLAGLSFLTIGRTALGFSRHGAAGVFSPRIV